LYGSFGECEALCVETSGARICSGEVRLATAAAVCGRGKRTGAGRLHVCAEADAATAQSGAIGALLRRESLYSSHLATWRRERQAGILKGLTPHRRGPKSKRNPQEDELQKLRRDNQRLTEQLRKAEIVIDVQKKVGALLGWPLPKADPEERL